MADRSWDRTPIEPQSVLAPLSRSAIFLVATVADDGWARTRDVLADIGSLVETVGFRDLAGRLSCIVGIGSRAWDRLFPSARPAELHEFPEIRGGAHAAVSTPGDLLFHIRAERQDFCFELERIILDSLGDAIRVVDEVVGFRYFDARDLLGFVDGTANPTGAALRASALVGDADPAFAGGSYVVVQKYLHDLQGWRSLSTEEQERIIGRTKIDNIELESAAETRKSHKSLATITGEDGVEHDILRDNMPFGRAGQGEFGTYFIGYAAELWVIERMLQRMFVGDPVGAYDRILDFSTPVTGTTFFAPANEMLERLAAGQ